MERQTQPDVDHVLLPACTGAETGHIEVSEGPVDVVHDRREGDVTADTHVITCPRGEPPSRSIHLGTGIDVVPGESEATGDEEAAGRDGVAIERRGDIPRRLVPAEPDSSPPLERGADQVVP